MSYDTICEACTGRSKDCPHSDVDYCEVIKDAGSSDIKIPIPKQDRGFPRFRQRIFISIDISGSTGYKQSYGNTWGSLSKEPGNGMQGQAWVGPFGSFLSRMLSFLEVQWVELSKDLTSKEKEELEVDSPPRLWKAIGDEVVFMKEITDRRQALLAIRATIEAMKNYKNSVMKSETPTLDLKATAWLAGLPINNAEFVLGPKRKDLNLLGMEDDYALQHYLRPWLYRIRKENGERIDYLGPQMDVGFRLSGVATPRRMMLSAELVYMLCDIAETGGEGIVKDLRGDYSKESQGYSHLRIGFSGMQILKGVLSGTPYPLFWIVANDDEIQEAEDRLGLTAFPNITDVISYCRTYLESDSEERDGGWPNLPFVAKDLTYKKHLDRNKDYLKEHFDGETTAPARYEERLEALQQTFRSLLITAVDKAKSNDGTDNTPDGNAKAFKDAKKMIKEVSCEKNVPPHNSSTR